MTKLLLTFIILNIVNVILQTVKSLCTVKCGKVVASVVNAVAYGLYTVVIIYTVCDLPLLTKALVVAFCNLIGVFVVKLIEEKSRKDKLWKVETTVLKSKAKEMAELIELAGIPFNYYDSIGKYSIFNIYCETQSQSLAIKEIMKKFKVKYFVTETKTL